MAEVQAWKCDAPLCRMVEVSDNPKKPPDGWWWATINHVGQKAFNVTGCSLRHFIEAIEGAREER